MIEIDTKQFTWTGDKGIADVTDIFGLMQYPKEFAVKGSRKTVNFRFSDNIYYGKGEDREHSGWEFVSLCRQFTITLLND